MIGSGDAHLTTLDGGDMVTANIQGDMVPLLFENYGVAVGTSYYAVAAVRKVTDRVVNGQVRVDYLKVLPPWCIRMWGGPLGELGLRGVVLSG